MTEHVKTTTSSEVLQSVSPQKKPLIERARDLAQALRKEKATEKEVVYLDQLAKAARALFSPENFERPTEQLIRNILAGFSLFMAKEFISQFPGEFNAEKRKEIRRLFLTISRKQASYAKVDYEDGKPKVSIKDNPAERQRSADTAAAQHTGYIASMLADKIGWNYDELNSVMFTKRLLFPSDEAKTKTEIIGRLVAELEKLHKTGADIKTVFEKTFDVGEKNWAIYDDVTNKKYNMKNTPFAGEASVDFDQKILNYSEEDIKAQLQHSNDELLEMTQPSNPNVTERMSTLFKAFSAKIGWTNQFLIDSLAKREPEQPLFDPKKELHLTTFFGMLRDVIKLKGKAAADEEAKKDTNQIRDFMKVHFGWVKKEDEEPEKEAVV